MLKDVNLRLLGSNGTLPETLQDLTRGYHAESDIGESFDDLVHCRAVVYGGNRLGIYRAQVDYHAIASRRFGHHEATTAPLALAVL